MEYAISLGLKQANLTFGTDVSKTRWAPDRSVYKEPIELGPAMPYRYAHAAYQRLRKVMEDERSGGANPRAKPSALSDHLPGWPGEALGEGAD